MQTRRARCAARRLSLIAALALFAWLAPASAREAGDNLEISLLTFAPGQIYWERFGHNALLVHDRSDDTSLIYNYGMFDFEEKGFFLNFVRGHMHYHLAAFGLADTLWNYDYEGRGINAQLLNLPPGQRDALNEFLKWNAQPENATYDYDYFLANCSTKLRDALDRVLGGELKHQLEAMPTDATFRSEAVRLIWPDHAFALAMDLGLGPLADRPISVWERSYVPDALENAVRHVQITGADGRSQPLVSSERRMLANRVPDPPAQLPDLRGLLAGIGIGIAILLLALARVPIAFSVLATVASVALGLAGVVLLAIWFGTDHWAGARNPHLLQFDPLCLLLIPGFFTAKISDLHRRLAIGIAIGGVAGLGLSYFGPGAASRHWIYLALPVLIAFAIAPRLRESA